MTRASKHDHGLGRQPGATGSIDDLDRLVDAEEGTWNGSSITSLKTSSRTFPSQSEEYEEALDKIEADQEDPPDYDLNGYNCTDWVLDVAQAAGQSLPDTQGNWLRGGGSNPGDLGEDLIEQGGQRTNRDGKCEEEEGEGSSGSGEGAGEGDDGDGDSLS